MSYSTIRVEKSGPLAWLTLNRPQARNSMTLAFFRELPHIMAGLDRDDSIRAVIIKAEGRSFTAGMDLADLAEIISDKSASARERLRRLILEFQESISAVERCRKPVIAAVHSHCIGGGVDLTSACDIRLAAEDAVFAIRETRMAIIADLGTLQRLPTLIGQGRTRELALTGRDFSAAEALEMGFVSRICQDQEKLYGQAEKLGLELAANSPLAVQGTKEVILFSQENGLRAGLEYVAQKNAAVLQSNDLMEAVRAFREKRKPQFKGD